MNTLRIAAASIAVLLSTIIIADARRSGACDGFHRCRCGVTAARYAGLPLNYHGLNLKEARAYYAFPRTTCHAGAVGIPHAHHVYTVRQCNGNGTAVVSDDAGTYTRRVAGNVFVDVTGGVGRQQIAETRHYSARSRRHYRQIASYQQQPQTIDRFGAGSVH